MMYDCMYDCRTLFSYFNNLKPQETFDIQSHFIMSACDLLWYGRLQLLFRCTLCSIATVRQVDRHLEV